MQKADNRLKTLGLSCRRETRRISCRQERHRLDCSCKLSKTEWGSGFSGNSIQKRIARGTRYQAEIMEQKGKDSRK